MDAICTFNYARWVPQKAGEFGRWEYFVKEVNGKVGWVVDEEMREKIREEPKAYGEENDCSQYGMSALCP